MSDKPNERKTPLTDAVMEIFVCDGVRRACVNIDHARALERHAEALADQLEIIHQNAVMCRMNNNCGYYAQNWLSSIIQQANSGMNDWQAFKREKGVAG